MSNIIHLPQMKKEANYRAGKVAYKDRRPKFS